MKIELTFEHGDRCVDVKLGEMWIATVFDPSGARWLKVMSGAHVLSQADRDAIEAECREMLKPPKRPTLKLTCPYTTLDASEWANYFHVYLVESAIRTAPACAHPEEILDEMIERGWIWFRAGKWRIA